MTEARKKLYEMCNKTNTSRSGMDYLVNYYIKSLSWSEEEACKYALSLFHDWTITQIKLIGNDCKELWVSKKKKCYLDILLEQE